MVADQDRQRPEELRRSPATIESTTRPPSPRPSASSDVLNDPETAARSTARAMRSPALDTVTCTYAASPATPRPPSTRPPSRRPVTRRMATTTPIEWTENLTGYDSGEPDRPALQLRRVDLRHERRPSTRRSPARPTRRLHGRQLHHHVTNWAYLDGNINLEASASVTVLCELPAPTADQDRRRHLRPHLTPPR